MKLTVRVVFIYHASTGRARSKDFHSETSLNYIPRSWKQIHYRVGGEICSDLGHFKSAYNNVIIILILYLLVRMDFYVWRSILIVNTFLYALININLYEVLSYSSIIPFYVCIIVSNVLYLYLSLHCFLCFWWEFWKN